MLDILPLRPGGILAVFGHNYSAPSREMPKGDQLRNLLARFEEDVAPFQHERHQMLLDEYETLPNMASLFEV